jgi:hypothetical protein
MLCLAAELRMLWSWLSPGHTLTSSTACALPTTPDPALCVLKDELVAGQLAASWSLIDDMVAFYDSLYIPPASPLFQELLAIVHEDGHKGVPRMLHRLCCNFHFHSPNLRTIIQDFVRACATCQQNKSVHLYLAGLLLPLPVPSTVWMFVGLDFIKAPSHVNDKLVILTVVDRFSKYCHFIPLAHPYTAKAAVQVFFSESMVSDLDPVFTLTFQQELLQLTKTKLHMTSTFHPQSDGQT